jgi:hypothetical protein
MVQSRNVSAHTLNLLLNVEPVPTNRNTTSTKYPRTRSLHPQVAGLFRCSSIISKAQVVGRRISLRLSKSSLIQSHFDPINTHTSLCGTTFGVSIDLTYKQLMGRIHNNSDD